MPKVTRDDTGKRGRTYLIHKEDGSEMRFPSVTSRLQLLAKPALLPWAKKQVTDYIYAHVNDLRACKTKEEVGVILDDARKADTAFRDKAADIGSLAHAECERLLRKQMTVEQANPAVAHMVRAFDDWCKMTNFEMLRAEDTVYNEEQGFAGTLDIIGKVYGKLAVIDIKTSSGIYPEMKFQVAAYAEAVNKMGLTDGKVEEGWILKLAKKADDPNPFEACYIDSAEMAECYSVFSHLHEIGKYFDKLAPYKAKTKA
jgi:hypothetical protein